jgi:hypothetical protein
MIDKLTALKKKTILRQEEIEKIFEGIKNEP